VKDHDHVVKLLNTQDWDLSSILSKHDAT